MEDPTASRPRPELLATRVDADWDYGFPKKPTDNACLSTEVLNRPIPERCRLRMTLSRQDAYP